MCLVASLWAGEIRLQVKDTSGAAMRASGKFDGKPFETDALGQYTFPNLSLGSHSLEIQREGFRSQSLDLKVDSEAPVPANVTLLLRNDAGSSVNVIASLPLPGLNLSRDEIPAPIQTANALTIENSGATDLSDFMAKRMGGVYLNEIQGNPFQADVNFRGYTASPLLGTPQGLAVYMDGMRLNQPFGDVVSWDLIPRLAIAETTLIPGSNPLFGLNTLGGAIAIESKSGLSTPGTSIQVSGGSFGRRVADMEHGGVRGHFDWYLASTLFFEDGWRQSSPSNVRQFFAKPGWKNDKTRIALSLSYANNNLTGNGLQDERFLQQDYTSVYTKPDITANRSPLLNAHFTHSPKAGSVFAGNVYYRYIRTRSLNGDLNDDSLNQSVYQPSAAERAALTAAGYSGFPTSGATAANTPFPKWRCIGQALLLDEPAEKCNGLITRSTSLQHNFGVSGQWTKISSRNQFTAGAAWDGTRVRFHQLAQLGYLNPDRSVTGVPAYADGVRGGDEDGVPFNTQVRLQGHGNNVSVFATNNFTITRRMHLTTSGRYNRTVIENLDRLIPLAGPGSLTGRHVFERFNPSVGLTYTPVSGINTYFSFSEASRAPTSIELGCADPSQPCKLPNSMAGDPPLKQVVTRTFEAGLRSSAEARLNWNLGWYRAGNRDDILFVASGVSGFGYFRNFGKTLRQGVDVGASTRFWKVLLGGNYNWLDATYQSHELVDGSSNSSNSTARAGVKGLAGSIPVKPGDSIPLVPAHSFKAYADIRPIEKLSIDLGMTAFSSSYARGNEDNKHMADGTYYLGSGKSPGYAVVNLGSRYRINRHFELFGQINNLLNRRYYSAAQLGPIGFTSAGAFQARPFPAVNGEYPIQHGTFYAPGAPRSIVGGMRVRF